MAEDLDTRAKVLIQLAERCEAAPGCDRDLEGDIYQSLGGEAFWGARTPDGRRDVRNPVPHYTLSLDAAMLLVPEGWATFLAAEDRHSHSWRWELRGGYGIKVTARANGPAKALTAAALLAQATQHTTPT